MRIAVIADIHGNADALDAVLRAAAAERAETLCNAGVLCADGDDMARWLGEVRADNAKGECYLTDVVALARADGGRVAAVEAPADELAGPVRLPLGPAPPDPGSGDGHGEGLDELGRRRSNLLHARPSWA